MSDELQKAYEAHIQALRNLSDILEGIIKTKEERLSELEDRYIRLAARVRELE